MRIFQRLRNIGLAAAVVALAAVSGGAQAATGLIILEGSDAQTFHGLQPYSGEFQGGLQTYSSAPTLPVLAIGFPPIGMAPAGTVFAADLTGMTGASLIATYSGLYIGSPGSCCSENDGVVASAAAQAAILAFHAAGRSIAIENYQGGAAFQFLLGFTLTGNDVIGFGTSGGGASCFDGNQITPVGNAFGFSGTTLPSIGCFGHQAYKSSTLNALGFFSNLADNPSFPGYTVVTSNGGGGLPPPTGVPAPASLLLLGVALAGLTVVRRRQA